MISPIVEDLQFAHWTGKLKTRGKGLPKNKTSHKKNDNYCHADRKGQPTAVQLKGAAKRKFIAQTVLGLGYGGQRLAERELGWNRETIRKGIKEVKTGITCVENYRAKGRKKIEENLPNLLSDLKKLVDSQSQTDPSFKSQRLYTRLSAAEVRKQLISKCGYSSEELPTVETIRLKLNELGYRLRRVAKVQPQKKFRKLMPSSHN